MEAGIRSLEGIKDVSIDFVSKRMKIETDGSAGADELMAKIGKIVTRIEPDVKIIPEQGAAEKKGAEAGETGGNRKRVIARLAAGGILFAAGILFDFTAWAELAVFLASYLIVGWDVLLRAVKGILRGQVFSEHFLMSVATVGAFFVGAYPEGAAVMIFYLVGELFEDMAVEHSRSSISSLMDIRPDYANLQRGKDILRVSPEEVKVGDVIVIKPGEKIPLDGKVVAGYSSVDTSALTGESMPRDLEPGKEALSGFVNKNGVLTVEVTKEFGESTVSKILDLVQNASSRKAPTENFITKFARYYTPAVVFSALALAVVPPLVVPGATFSGWLYRALVFLVVSCPCALVISVPLGFFGGIGGASKRGILVKGSNFLEALNYVETVVFDKTGTLTEGAFEVTELNEANGFAKDEVIELAAYAESYSNHPIAFSIVEEYGREIDKAKILKHQEIPGQGVKVRVDGREVLAGNTRLMENEGIEFAQADGFGTAVYVAVDRKYAGSILISDKIKEDSADAIRQLKALGISNTVLLTGDLKSVGEKIGKQLGVGEVFTEMLPADKVDRIESMEIKKSRRGKIVFVGDGINDAPVLARADIGIAMGGLGSDAAIEAADIVIMTDEPSKVATAIRIAKKTRLIVVQNIVFALGVKSVFLILGAFGVATMWEAVFADMGVALIAIFNAMRVMNTKNV
jgi:Cd2+/Zn2+-exporting ATPase